MNLGGVKDLLASERGVFAIAVTLFASGLVYVDKMTVAQWIDFTQWIALTLIASKTFTTAAEIFKRPGAAATTQPPLIPSTTTPTAPGPAQT